VRFLIAASLLFLGCAPQHVGYSTTFLPSPDPPPRPDYGPGGKIGSFAVVSELGPVSAFTVKECGIEIDGQPIGKGMTFAGEHRLEATICYQPRYGTTSSVAKRTRDMHFVVAPQCQTEIFLHSFERDVEPPDLQFAERLTCPVGHAAYDVIPASRALPPVPTTDDDASVRAWMTNGLRFVEDGERYVAHAMDVVRANKDVIWLLCLHDKHAQLSVIRRSLLERIAWIDRPTTDDALRRHELTIAKILCDRAAQLEIEASQCV